MKPIMISSIKLIFFSLALIVCTTITAFGQSARLQLDHLDRLNAIADQSVDVTVDQKVLNLAKIFLAKSKDPEQQKIRELIGEIEGIYVKHFTFESAGQYSLSDIETIRTQLNGPGWSRMAGVRSKRNKQNLDVYTMIQGSKIGGLAVIAAEEKELTVVNIIGPIDLEKLMELEGSFSIPSLEIERIKEKTQKE
ncbi:MAG TPA: DUF4252 domain-containing protein [Pyrinomonadaceae bacterium]|jgi:hypothetical protein|nr:DUF4252 domain-containing protein [Pyrinomonadaceae bacterium]